MGVVGKGGEEIRRLIAVLIVLATMAMMIVMGASAFAGHICDGIEYKQTDTVAKSPPPPPCV
jgi:hypothetical protein